MHHHNWWMRSDAAHNALAELAHKWVEWGVDPGVQVDLVSPASVENGKCVTTMLRNGCCAEGLPIKLGHIIPALQASLGSFVERILWNVQHPVPARLRTYVYSRCKDDPQSSSAKAQTETLQSEVLSETVQCASCAAGREVRHILPGSRPPHAAGSRSRTHAYIYIYK